MSDFDSNVIRTSKQMDKIDSDVEETDDDTSDNDDQFNDLICLPSEYENEVEDINSLSKYPQQRFNACPMFFMGSLKDACQAGFDLTTIQERRPVLVYIHQDGNLFREKFCETKFYSNEIIDCLNINYVVWPYGVDSELNRYALGKIWEEMFSTPFFHDFSIKQCPLLIGITRLLDYKINGVITVGYKFKTLVKSNTLLRIKMPVNSENLFDELSTFKEQCDKNEKDLSFSFVNKTGLSWEVILEIAQYLSLNDMISAFSFHILPLLNYPQLKFQLSNPFDPSVQKILSKINFEQITSLQLNPSRFGSETELIFLSKFKEVRSLTLRNPLHSYQVSRYTRYFPSLICLSLYYDTKANYFELYDTLNQLRYQIRRYEMHCPGIFCNDNDKHRVNKWPTIETQVEYFLLDVCHYSLTSPKTSLQQCQLDLYMPISDFMKNMPNIRHICIFSNEYNIEHFLNDKQWTSVLTKCSGLKKIILQVLGNLFQDKQLLIKKVLLIEMMLRTIRQTIKYQIIFV